MPQDATLLSPCEAKGNLMAQTTESGLMAACKKIGISKEEYLKNRVLGLKWCYGCRLWHNKDFFSKDVSRFDGLTATCIDYRKKSQRDKYKPKPRPEKGRRFVLPRDGDKKQARRRVSYKFGAGLIPHPNELPCVDCGHVYINGGRRHEYDHYKGYSSEHHESVECVCSKCHHERTRICNNLK